MKISKKARLLLDMMLGLLIVQPVEWEMFQIVSRGRLPTEFIMGFMIFCDILAIAWFLQCRTPDKTEVKPKWW